MTQSGYALLTGTRVVLAVEKKLRRGETRVGGPYEIAIGAAVSAAVRRHHSEQRGGTAIVTSHSRR